LQVILSEDYEVISSMYKLCGANSTLIKYMVNINMQYKYNENNPFTGRLCCFWCTISSADLKVP